MTFTNSFVPNGQIIQSITNSNPGIVTTTTPHGYRNGLYVRLFLPEGFGMKQVNNQVYLITVLTNSSFAIDTDTSSFDAFTLLPSTQKPQVIPVGEVALTLNNVLVNNDNIIPEL